MVTSYHYHVVIEQSKTAVAVLVSCLPVSQFPKQTQSEDAGESWAPGAAMWASCKNLLTKCKWWGWGAGGQGVYSDLQLRRGDFHRAVRFGENVGLLPQHKEVTLGRAVLETSEEDPGTGALCCRLAGFTGHVSDALGSASNCCLPDCSPLQVIMNCCEGGTPKETMEKLLHRMSEDRTVTAESLVKLLQAVKPASPNLGLLLENLQRLATSQGTAGIR